MQGSASVSVIPLATITTQPTAATVCEDGTATFIIQATGVNLSYQWVKDGANVGTNNVLVLNNISLSDNNSEIYCEVTSTCGGTVPSNHIRLYVNPKTLITTHPVSMNNCTGSGVTLSVTASGINNSYRWEKGGVPVNNIAGKISGATSANLTIINLTVADAGAYIAYVDGDCGNEVPSNPANLTIDDPNSNN